MGTKNDPGEFDCYANALRDEPMFILLARDPDFARLVREWAVRRGQDIACGNRPGSDMPMVDEAYATATRGAKWRLNNMGKWRVRPKGEIACEEGCDCERCGSTIEVTRGSRGCAYNYGNNTDEKIGDKNDPNYSNLCPPCWVEERVYWEEMWSEYYGGRL